MSEIIYQAPQKARDSGTGGRDGAGTSAPVEPNALRGGYLRRRRALAVTQQLPPATVPQQEKLLQPVKLPQPAKLPSQGRSARSSFSGGGGGGLYHGLTNAPCDSDCVMLGRSRNLSRKSMVGTTVLFMEREPGCAGRMRGSMWRPECGILVMGIDLWACRRDAAGPW